MKRLVWVLAVFTSGCQDLVGPREPIEFPDAVEYFDASLFPPVWAELRACSKLSGDLRRVSFYYVPRPTLRGVNPNIRTIGLYYPRTNRIFVIESEQANRSVIRHEMMHALLRDADGHPPQYFGADGLCGPV